VGIGASDQPVENERVGKGQDIAGGVGGLIPKECGDFADPGTALVLVFPSGMNCECLAGVFLVNTQARSSCPIRTPSAITIRESLMA